MDDPALVRLMDRQRDIAQHGDLVLERHPSRRLVERLAVDELKREVRPSLHLIDLVHAADVGMRDVRLCTRFAEQAKRQARINAQDELDGDDAAEPAVARLVHQAHPALAEQLEQLVALPARHRRPARGYHRRRRFLWRQRVRDLDIAPRHAA
jgi:hypothetical protein